jgi:hypothetical protein
VYTITDVSSTGGDLALRHPILADKFQFIPHYSQENTMLSADKIVFSTDNMVVSTDNMVLSAGKVVLSALKA